MADAAIAAVTKYSYNFSPVAAIRETVRTRPSGLSDGNPTPRGRHWALGRP